MPFTTSRWSRHRPPHHPFYRNNGATRAHAPSVNSPVLTIAYGLLISWQRSMKRS